jgi:murein DD-endopeptidase MepM/ murein hydrolase activator NlpD
LLKPFRSKPNSSVGAPRTAKAAVAVAAVLASAGLAGIAYAASHDLQQQLSDARNRSDLARERESALAGGIAAQSDRIDAVEVQIAGLRGELASLGGRLHRARSRLRALETELAEKTLELARARRQFKVAQARLSDRVVEVYTSEEPDVVSVTLGADSLDDAIDQLDTRKRMLEYDEQLVTETRSLRERMRRERARTASLRRQQAIETGKLAEHTAARRAAFSALVAQRNSLAAMRAARQELLASVQVQRRDWENQADALAAQSAQVAAASTAPVLLQAPQAASSPATPSSAGFAWPVRGSIVSPFGQRWGRLHSGIDISAPAGTPIAASAAGQVVHSGSMSGYGLLVVIQHAGGVSTAYAHNSSNSVSAGQTVSQGQTIAAVGCTGHCFGDHVHFEVRVGGSPVDPMGYL